MKPTEIDHRSLNELYGAILRLKTRDECKKFFRDLATLKELKDLSDRWEVARMIHRHISYRDIAKKTGVSTATITRVANWIRHGEGGYELMLKRLAV
ncbi:MAG: YerC/YecD family TrpR-related protein [Patescibacteria group bacterium]